VGAQAYHIISELNLDSDAVILEIGAERGEGSTQHFYNFCEKNNLCFITVDFEVQAVNRAKYISRDGISNQWAFVYHSTGEDFLENVFPTMDKKITFAYLDNFDWLWEGSESDSFYGPARVLYQSYGIEMNNKNSQLAHLEQAKLVNKFSSENCHILLDDTYENTAGDYNGKGGMAVPYLLSKNWNIINQYDTTQTMHLGWYLLKKGV
jgi:hypothetical protein